MEEWRDRGIGLRQWMDGQGSGMDGWRGLPVDGQQRDGAQGTEGWGSRDRAQGMELKGWMDRGLQMGMALPK